LILSWFLELPLQTFGPLLGLLTCTTLPLPILPFLPGLVLGLQAFRPFLLELFRQLPALPLQNQVLLAQLLGPTLGFQALPPLLFELLYQWAVLPLQLRRSLPIRALGLLLVLQALLPLPLQFLHQAPAFFVQELQAGLLFAQILHAILGKLRGPSRIPESESRNDQDHDANDEGADANQVRRFDHAAILSRKLPLQRFAMILN
jgi:hypothetical protein